MSLRGLSILAIRLIQTMPTKLRDEKHIIYYTMSAWALVQLLKMPAWKVEDGGLEPRSGNKVLKKQNVSSLLTRKDLMLWGASVTDRDIASSASLSNSVSGGRLTSFTSPLLLVRFSLYVQKGGLKPIHFILIYKVSFRF